jgi:hypothetical protein
MTNADEGEPTEGLWVGTMWENGERTILPLVRFHADGDFDLLEDAYYSVPVRAALRAIIDEHMSWPTPRIYRITPAHLERHPILINTVLSGRWQRNTPGTP